MQHEVTASAEALMKQASYTAEYYLDWALDILKKHSKNPSLTDAIALASIMATDFDSVNMLIASQNIQNGLDGLRNSIDGHNDNLEKIADCFSDYVEK